MTHPYTEVAIAILHQADRFLMQLRDDIPGLVYAGHWGFFGGHLDANELPDQAVRRELLEEIGYAPKHLAQFGQYKTPTVIRHVYVGQLDIPISQLVLNEGWDLGLLTLEEIQAGQAYSERAQQIRPLGEPHQKILLDFITQGI